MVLLKKEGYEVVLVPTVEIRLYITHDELDIASRLVNYFREKRYLCNHRIISIELQEHTDEPVPIYTIKIRVEGTEGDTIARTLRTLLNDLKYQLKLTEILNTPPYPDAGLDEIIDSVWTEEVAGDTQ